MLTVAICDDDFAEVEKIAQLVKEWALGQSKEQICIRQFSSPYLLLDAVLAGETFDFFLLDILMPEMTGISLGDHLRSLISEPLLVYLTSSEDYYSEAFRLYAFQYICKPIFKDNLFPVLDKARLRCEKRKKDVYILKTADGIVQIPQHTIVYLELRSHVCRIHLMDGQQLQSLYLRIGFDRFIAPLLQQDQFVKTHASFVVNLDFVDRLSSNTLILTTGVTIPITRSFATQVQRQYMTHGLHGGSDLL